VTQRHSDCWISVSMVGRWNDSDLHCVIFAYQESPCESTIGFGIEPQVECS